MTSNLLDAEQIQDDQLAMLFLAFRQLLNFRVKLSDVYDITEIAELAKLPGSLDAADPRRLSHTYNMLDSARVLAEQRLVRAIETWKDSRDGYYQAYRRVHGTSVVFDAERVSKRSAGEVLRLMNDQTTLPLLGKDYGRVEDWIAQQLLRREARFKAL